MLKEAVKLVRLNSRIKFSILVIVVIIIGFNFFNEVENENELMGNIISWISQNWNTNGINNHVKSNSTTSSERYKYLSKNMEIVIRMTPKHKFLNRLFCDFLRSSAVFWDSRLLGNILLILDDKDKALEGPRLIRTLSTLTENGLNHKFRIVYEKEPIDKIGFAAASRRQRRPHGYMLQLYSSFIMDQYTDKEILAWCDTDIAFVLPVVSEMVMNNKGQLIVKGNNKFHRISWVDTWDRTATIALGFPLISDFMVFFPTYIFKSTYENCRKYILKRFKTGSMEEAFFKIVQGYVSPVSIIYNYAYHFEREKYEWHLDLYGMPLNKYNLDRRTFKSVRPKDITPSVHTALHRGYQGKIYAHEKVFCYTSFKLGLETREHCEEYKKIPNTIPYKDEDTAWWKNKKLRHLSADIVEKYYQIYIDETKKGIHGFNPGIIRMIEEVARKEYNLNCPQIKLPF